MSHLEHEAPRISRLKLNSQGQVTLSNEARQQHDLNAGDTLIEITLPSCVMLLPQSEGMEQLMIDAQVGIQKLGLSVDQFKDRVRKRADERLNERYPGIFDQ